MKIKDCDVLTLRIAYLLLSKYDYKLLLVQNDEKNIWLTNVQAKDFSLVKISSCDESDGFFNENRTDMITERVSQALGMANNLLEIFTNSEALSFLREKGKSVLATNIVAKLPDELIQTFPQLSEAFMPIEDPVSEYESVSKKIEDLQKKTTKRINKKAKDVPLVTISVAVACVAIYLLGQYLRSFNSDQVAVAISIGAYYKAFVLGLSQYWRFLSAGFVHMDIWHLIMNLYALLNMGYFIEPVLGRVKYSIVLFTGVICGTWLVFVSQGNTVVLGLSAGIYAIFAIILIYFYKSGMFKNPQFRRQIVFMVTINVLISMSPNVSWAGHLGGALVGAFFGIIYFYDSNRNLQINTLIAAGILTAYLTYLTINVKPLDQVYLGTDNKVIEIYRKVGMDDYADTISEKLLKYYVGDK